MSRAPLLALVLLLLAGCVVDSVPHPFAADKPTPTGPVFTLKDSVSIAVAPVAGVAAPAREKLAGAVAAALQDADILATANETGGERLSLLGTAHAAGSNLSIEWRLVDLGGKAVGQTSSTAPVALETVNRGDPGAMKAVARAAVPAVSVLLQDEAPGEAPAPDLRRVVIRPVTGAPGDGKDSLRLAMAAALTQAKLTVVPGSADPSGALAVVGTVRLDPPKEGKQRIAISWTLLDGGGRELGVVSQQNAVPQGSLNGRWGEVANLVATAAAPGIVALISKAEERRPGS